MLFTLYKFAVDALRLTPAIWLEDLSSPLWSAAWSYATASSAAQQQFSEAKFMQAHEWEAETIQQLNKAMRWSAS